MQRMQQVLGPSGLLWSLILGFTAGCLPGPKEQEPGAPAVVGVFIAVKRDIPELAKPNGTTRALEEVSIRARVRGFLEERHFDEGSFVKKGQLLLVIEEAGYQATLRSAEAKLEKAKADLKKAQLSKMVEIAVAQLALDRSQLVLAEIEERRTRNLVARNTASREDLDKAEAERKKYEAQVNSDIANLEQSKSDYETNILSAKGLADEAAATVDSAKLDLGYCRMYAPFDGRIGEALVKVGNLVGPSSSTGQDTSVLATIQQLDPMGVDVQVSSRYLDRASRLVPLGLPIQLTRPGIEGERDHPYPGRCFFIDNTIDKTTSTFLVKARIPNPRSSLLPGEYVKLRITVGETKDAVVVPEQAVIQTQAGPVVYLVDTANKVVIQRVEAMDQAYEGLRVITSGLKAGAKVIVEGLQLVRPNVTVDPKPYQPPRAIPSAEPAEVPRGSDPPPPQDDKPAADAPAPAK